MLIKINKPSTICNGTLETFKSAKKYLHILHTVDAAATLLVLYQVLLNLSAILAVVAMLEISWLAWFYQVEV